MFIHILNLTHQLKRCSWKWIRSLGLWAWNSPSTAVRIRGRAVETGKTPKLPPLLWASYLAPVYKKWVKSLYENKQPRFYLGLVWGCFKSLSCDLGDAPGFLSGSWQGTEATRSWDVEEKLTKERTYRGVDRPREPRGGGAPGGCHSGKRAHCWALKGRQRETVFLELGDS